MSASDGDADAAPSGGVPPPMTPPTLKGNAVGDDECEGNDNFEAADVGSEAASAAGKGRREVAGPGGRKGAAVLRPSAKIRAQAQATSSVQRPAVKLKPQPPWQSPPTRVMASVVPRPLPPPPPMPVAVGSIDRPIGCRMCNECGQAAYWRKGLCLNEECILYKGPYE